MKINTEQQTIQKIVNWLKKKLKESGQRGFVLGLSGGIDSALVAALALRATPDTLGIIMPCHSCERDVRDARAVARKLKLKTKLIDLSGIYDSYLQILPEADRLANSNIKPRLRMTTLYHIAASHKFLVLGTGNKSELSIGYFTKYGDGGADLLPIGSLLKRDVYGLARELDIPKALIDKPPSAGLWENQTDENEMGITYKQLDETLYAFEKGIEPESVDKKIIKRIKTLNSQSAHKRRLPEICIL